ncbi:MAG: hypothetical protein MRY83_20005 [Flavobacteriales bacterium]|nr:hypothetical protein [Flavobacteriales bacterium]
MKTIVIIILATICSLEISSQDFRKTHTDKGPAGLGGTLVMAHKTGAFGYQVRARIPICTHLWLNPIYQVVDPNGKGKDISTALQFDYDLFQICNTVPYLSSSLRLNNLQFINNSGDVSEVELPYPSIDVGIGFDIKVIDHLSLVLESKYDLVPASFQSNIGARLNFVQAKKRKKRKRRK